MVHARHGGQKDRRDFRCLGTALWSHAQISTAYWNETLVTLYAPNRIEAFVRESGKIAAHVITRGKTRKYLKTTTELVVKQLSEVVPGQNHVLGL